MAQWNWTSFWDSEHSIYVNAHHKQVHYRRIADDLPALESHPRTSNEVTDCYLAELASRHRMKLATMDAGNDALTGPGEGGISPVPNPADESRR